MTVRIPARANFMFFLALKTLKGSRKMKWKHEIE